MKKFYGFLDKHVFPYIVSFVAHPFIILLTIALFVPMVWWQKSVILILLLNSYMNVGSFSASQITLRQVLLTSDKQEQRDQETHDAVIQQFNNHSKILDEVTEELEIARQQREEAKQQREDTHELLKNVHALLKELGVSEDAAADD